ncbi:hypothetical protein INS49_004666 [Diaporthe citri]|uniref:uncharacterized protein n=1 Tax=Diaporthe citri TaxID=83186 RepID=UPI001C8150DF|nr:uncharacterized protein INS49_004666 [Diaporthe citri]KAG6354648.1 hypothetical protein INS49_004666 [Diaporthe citri]
MGISATAGGDETNNTGKDPVLIKIIEAADVVGTGRATRLCRGLMLPLDAFDMAQPLHVYGVESFVAVEMRNWLMQTLKADIAVFEILGGSTAETLGRTVADKVRASL